jgi:hypothetical protein
MGISPELLSDAALNVVGCLLAGALLTLIYSSVTNRAGKKAAAAPVNLAQRPHETPATGEGRRSEFVNLRNVAAGDNLRPTSGRSAAETAARQRNRTEVMRLAREMLRSGTPRDSVRTLLPISEGELAMLDNQRA